METKTSRRALLGAIAVAPAALAAAPAAASGNVLDPVWPNLVADFRAKHAAWMATINPQEAAASAYRDALATLPHPTKPALAGGGDILDKTLRELRDASDTPEHSAAWAEYQLDQAAWERQRDALREQILGPAEAAYDQTFAIRSAALNALIAHRVASLRDLAEKIEIMTRDSGGEDVPGEHMAEVLADVRNLTGEG